MNELTEEQILGLQGRDLRFAIARVLGWTDLEATPICPMGRPPQGFLQRIPAWPNSLDAVRPVLVKTLDETCHQAYIRSLERVVGVDLMEHSHNVYDMLTMLLTAEPSDICKAILLTYSQRRPVEDPASSEGVELT